MTIHAHPQIAAKGFVYASCHGRREARRAVTALLRNRFPLRRIHVLVSGPTGLSRVKLKYQHHGGLGAAAGILAGLAALLIAQRVGSEAQGEALSSLAVGTRAAISSSIALTLAAVGYWLGRRRQSLAMECEQQVNNQSEILVGLYADHRQARTTRAALKGAQAGRTYVAHLHPNQRPASPQSRDLGHRDDREQSQLMLEHQSY